MFKSIQKGLFAYLLMGSAVLAHAQKKYTEGSITYHTTYFPTEEQKMAADLLPKEIIFYFKDNFVKNTIQIEKVVEVTQIQHLENFERLMLVDMAALDMKIATKMNKEEYMAEAAKQPKLIDFKSTGEKKKIGTYQAERYTYKDHKDNSYELWATEDVLLPTHFFGEEFKDVKGTLLIYTTFQDNLKVTLTFKQLEEGKVDPISLEVPEGYELVTGEEFKTMQGSGK